MVCGLADQQRPMGLEYVEIETCIDNDQVL